MKVSNKLSQHGYDLVNFMQRLDIHKNGMLHLHELFTELASQLSIYFSQYEQVAIHNLMFSTNDSKNAIKVVILGNRENVQKNLQKWLSNKDKQMKCLLSKSNFVESLILSKQEFEDQFKFYTIKRYEFLTYVMYEWQAYLKKLEVQVEFGFKDYDSLLMRNGLNTDQF